MLWEQRGSLRGSLSMEKALRHWQHFSVAGIFLWFKLIISF
jgi:hypothetical protein